MTKGELVNKIARRTGIERAAVISMIETMMEEISVALMHEESVYMRGFGSFMVRQRAEKKARDITKDTTIIVPAQKVPYFKPSKILMGKVRDSTEAAAKK
jgi:hypothetical protein